MKVEQIDGERLRLAVIAGAQSVIERQDFLNKINVFPVPDGDTGTNMALTLRAVSEGAVNAHSRELGPFAEEIAEAALMGARGNSGSILAQFFQGLAAAVAGRAALDTQGVADAAVAAAGAAREAVAAPREGTILSVMTAWAEYIDAHGRRAGDVGELLAASLVAAREALAKTPQQLEALRKAGVVDAGAQGFVHFLEGVVEVLREGRMRSFVPEISAPPVEAVVEENAAAIAFQFCTEGYIRGEDIDAAAVKRALAGLGDSMTCVGGGKALRVHLHTNEPEKLFHVLKRHGNLQQRKQEDMRAQHRWAHGDARGSDIALVVDSTASLPSEFLIRHRVRVVPLTVTFGDKTYLDWVNLSLGRFYRLLAESPHHPKTSQPPVGEWVKTFKVAGRLHAKTLALTVSAAMSGSHQAALSAAKLAGGDVTVVDSLHVGAGLGLITQAAAEAIEQGLPFVEVLRRVETAKRCVWTFLSVETLEYAVRGGRLGKSAAYAADFLRLRPVLTLTPDGTVGIAARTFGHKGNLRRALQLALDKAAHLRQPRFVVCHAQAPEAAADFADNIRRRFDVDEVPILHLSPSLGAHAGPGAVAVSVLGFPAGEEGF